MSAQALRLAVVGSVNLDFVATAERLPSPGETVGGAELARHPGGKGANQALAAARLGAQVHLHARVGRDPLAEEALALLRADGVDLANCLPVDAAPTGVALIAVARGGENLIVVAPGANRLFRASELGELDADALLCQLETPIDTVMAAIERFHGFVSVNLAPAIPVPEALLQRASLLIVNEKEAAFYGETLLGAPGLVAITYGGRGAALYRNNAVIARAEAPRVAVVDTTGAGDAFCAALTLALVGRRSYEEALAFACACGALAVTRAGAQPSLPWRRDVDAMLSRQAKGGD